MYVRMYIWCANEPNGHEQVHLPTFMEKKYGFDFRKYFSSNVKTIIIEKRSNFQFY